MSSTIDISGSPTKEDASEIILDGRTMLEPIDSIRNEILLSKNIKDDSPEILAISEFKTMYNKIGSTIEKNSNFDFMLFQNQLDLIIKEIINKKIENDPDLKEKILNQYKISLNEFANNKKDLESFYLSVINVFDLFNIQENLKSKIKSLEPGEATDLPGNSASALARSVANHAKHLGFDFNEEYLKSFLSSHSPGGVNSSAFFSSAGNVFYRILISFIYESYFDVPNFNLSYNNDFSFVKSPNDVRDRDFRQKTITAPEEDMSLFVKEVILLSRSNYVDFSKNSLKSIINLLSDLSEELDSKVNFEEFKDFGKDVFGNIDRLNPGDDKLLNQSNLYSVDQNNIQVYNSIIDPNEPTFRIPNSATSQGSIKTTTGKDYFSRDLITKLLDNDVNNSDMLSYANSMISKLSKVESFMSEHYDREKNSIFNGAISEIAKVIGRVFLTDSLTLNENEVIVDSRKVIDSLNMLNYIGNYPDKFNEPYTGTQKVTYTDEDYDGEWSNETVSLSANGTPNFGFYVFDYELLIDVGFVMELIENPELYEGFDGRSELLRDPRNLNETVVETKEDFLIEKESDENHFFKFLGISGFSSSLHNKLVDLRAMGRRLRKFFMEIKKTDLFKSQYLSDLQVWNTAFKILLYLFKDFKFRVGLDDEGVGGTINKKGLELLYVLQDLKDTDNIFNNKTKLPFRGSILGSSRPDSKFVEDRVRDLYRETEYGFFASYNIASSLKAYYLDIVSQVKSIGQQSLDISNILGANEFSLRNIGAPSVERLVNLNYGYKSIFSPTTSFNENMSYFPYKNTRTSNDLISINSFHKNNPLYLTNDENFEGIRIAAVGIPDGLINKLRLASGRSNNHTIIEISLFSLDHKLGDGGKENRFTCRYKFLFNSCLHVNTVNPNIDLLSNIALEDFSFEDILNIDNRNSFENLNLNEENLLSFNFGSIDFSDKNLILNTKNNFDDAILYNQKTYRISSNSTRPSGPEYIFNNAMSGKIIKNHVINYILKKNFEFFNGTSLSESSFPFFDTPFINLPTQESASLINYFNEQNYSDDLKDYLNRTSMTSPIINPNKFLVPAYGISSFERIFLLPCFISARKYSTGPEHDHKEHFSFKSLVPVVRLL